MPGTFCDFFPDFNALLSLEPEELAGIVLEFLNSLGDNSSLLNAHNFSVPSTVDEYPHEKKQEILQALMEAWVWLEREGLLAPKPGSFNEGWVFITRRGKQVSNRDGVERYRRSNLLPKQLLHPIIAEKIWSDFLRGEYDSAVFKAFKEIEVAVRASCGYSAADYGVDMMRKAFNPENGPLTDMGKPKSEREALSHLFSGSIGSYKNPHSHRNVILDATCRVPQLMSVLLTEFMSAS